MRREDIRYYVNEDKGTVVAVVDDCCFDALNTVLRKTGDIVPTISSLLLIPDTFRGIAKLHPADSWDLDEGKRQARRKLFRSYSRSKYTAYKNYTNKLQRLYESSINLVERSADHLE